MEFTIGYHCAPALAGIKPANLVSCYKNRGYNINFELQRLNMELNSKGIYLDAICECDKRVLVIAYRKKILAQKLCDAEISDFLKSLGYPENADTDAYIEFLKTRFREKEFPHEIGAFLGYPMHDIRGFMHHKGKECILCGEWKVYKNPEEAQKLFNRFSACRRGVARRMLGGDSLARVFSA